MKKKRQAHLISKRDNLLDWLASLAEKQRKIIVNILR